MRHWLMKSEPGSYSIQDLERDGRTMWDGVRNYQARNLMRDDMSVGDPVLFYHSNAKPPGVAGLARVVSEAYPDPTQFDRSSAYHDPASDPEAPRWLLVDIEFVQRFDEVLSLDELKADPRLEGMMVTQRGARLSVQPVDKRHYERIVKRATS